MSGEEFEDFQSGIDDTVSFISDVGELEYRSDGTVTDAQYLINEIGVDKLSKDNYNMEVGFENNNLNEKVLKTIINTNTSNLKTGGIYFLSAKDGDKINSGDASEKIGPAINTVDLDKSKNILSVLLPKVPINLLCQRRYISKGLGHAISSSCEPNIRNMGKIKYDTDNLYNETNKDQLITNIEKASGLYYEFILTEAINDTSLIEICTIGHNHDAEFTDRANEKRGIIGAFPSIRAQVSNDGLSDRLENDPIRGRHSAGGATVSGIAPAGETGDLNVRIPDKPFAHGNDMFGYVITKTTKNIGLKRTDDTDDNNYVNACQTNNPIPQLLSCPDITDVGDLFLNMKPEDATLVRNDPYDGRTLNKFPELGGNANNADGSKQGCYRRLFKMESLLYGDSAFPITYNGGAPADNSFVNFNAGGLNRDLGNSRAFSKKILFTGKAKPGDRITCLHNGLHWYVEAHTNSDKHFRRGYNDRDKFNPVLVMRAVYANGNSAKDRPLDNGNNPNRIQVRNGLINHEGGIIYY